MTKFALIIIAITVLILACGRQVSEGTTIKVVNDCNYSNNDLIDFINNLKSDLRGFNFTIKEIGETNYTIRINNFTTNTSSQIEYPPSDACNSSPETMEISTVSVSVDLCEYSSSILETWKVNKTYGESFVKRLIGGNGDGCTNYRVGKDLFDLIGCFKDLSNKVAKKTSRIVFRR